MGCFVLYLTAKILLVIIISPLHYLESSKLPKTALLRGAPEVVPRCGVIRGELVEVEELPHTAPARIVMRSCILLCHRLVKEAVVQFKGFGLALTSKNPQEFKRFGLEDET